MGKQYRGLRRPLASRQGTWTRNAGSLSLGLLTQRTANLLRDLGFKLKFLDFIAIPFVVPSTRIFATDEGAQGGGNTWNFEVWSIAEMGLQERDGMLRYQHADGSRYEGQWKEDKQLLGGDCGVGPWRFHQVALCSSSIILGRARSS